MISSRMSIFVLFLVTAIAGGVTDGIFPKKLIAGESGIFTGTWVANGSKELFHFSEKR